MRYKNYAVQKIAAKCKNRPPPDKFVYEISDNIFTFIMKRN